VTLRKKALTFIEAKIPINKYVLSFASYGTDAIEYVDEKGRDNAKLEEIGVRNYCTVFLSAPDDVRDLPWDKIAAIMDVYPALDYERAHGLLKLRRNNVAQVLELWRKVVQIREIIPVLDDTTIMEELDNAKGNVDTAISTLLGGGGKGKGRK